MAEQWPLLEEEEEEGLPRPWAQPGCSSFQLYTRTIKGHSRLVFKVRDLFYFIIFFSGWRSEFLTLTLPSPMHPGFPGGPSHAASSCALIEGRKAAKWLAQAAAPRGAHQSPARPPRGAARPWLPGGGFVPSTLRYRAVGLGLRSELSGCSPPSPFAAAGGLHAAVSPAPAERG